VVVLSGQLQMIIQSQFNAFSLTTTGGITGQIVTTNKQISSFLQAVVQGN